MQEKQFDNLMLGKDANWAELAYANDYTLANALMNKNISTEEKRELIEEKEVPIPTEIQSAVQKYIAEMRTKGVKERTIRRSVKKKWKIKVV